MILTNKTTVKTPSDPSDFKIPETRILNAYYLMGNYHDGKKNTL